MRRLSGYFWLPVIGAMMFNFIFWKEKFGINMMIFDLFILAATIYLYDFQSGARLMKWLLAANIFSVSMVIIQNSDTSIAAAWISLVLIVAFAQFRHRSPMYAMANGALNVLFFIPLFYKKLMEVKSITRFSNNWSRMIRLLFLPLCLAALFLLIYVSSNSVFSAWIERSVSLFHPAFAWIGSLFSFGRVMFLFFGLYIAGSLLLRNLSRDASDTDIKSDDTLVRKRMVKRKDSLFETGKKEIMGLKNFNTSGLISLGVLNILLLVMNMVDFSSLWVGTASNVSSILSKDLHDGTNTLIFSILLAMMVILFFFRGNLNFYKKNIWFKRAAYAWIAQNSFLTLSLFLRDYYYISNFGLTPKRIGVIYFLIFVMIGLVTVFVKIRFTRSFYFVFRVNSWAAVVVLITSTLINWDKQILDYNLSNTNKVAVDWKFLLTLSDATLPELDKHRQEMILADNNYQESTGHVYRYSNIDQLNLREQRFRERQEEYSWLSWNYSDFNTARRLAIK